MRYLSMAILLAFFAVLIAFNSHAQSPLVGSLIIPAIGLDSPIVALDYRVITINDNSYLEWQVHDDLIGWHKTTALLGQPGNTVLNGHSNTGGMVFGRLNELKIGDTLTLSQSLTYTVTDRVIVKEAGATIDQRLENAQWILPTSDTRITIITCITGTTHRLILVFKR